MPATVLKKKLVLGRETIRSLQTAGHRSDGGNDAEPHPDRHSLRVT